MHILNLKKYLYHLWRSPERLVASRNVAFKFKVAKAHFMVQAVRFAHVNIKNPIFNIKTTKNVTHIWIEFLKK